MIFLLCACLPAWENPGDLKTARFQETANSITRSYIANRAKVIQSSYGDPGFDPAASGH